eukprot:1055290-Prorocentrum_minimum.AAC.1
MDPRTKLVIRKLPPNLSQEAFQDTIGETFLAPPTWFAYTQGKVGHKRTVHSRAYINLKTPEDVLEFCEQFQNHLFVNERGHQFRAHIEFAPSQKVPKARQRRDPREGTIEKDPDYLKFVEELSKPEEQLPSAEVQLEKRDAEEKAALIANNGVAPVIITPLMAFLKQKAEEKRSRQKQQRAVAVTRTNGSSRSASDRDRRSRAEKERDEPVMVVKAIKSREKSGRGEKEQQHSNPPTVLMRAHSGRSTASNASENPRNASSAKPKAVAITANPSFFKGPEDGNAQPKAGSGGSNGRSKSGRDQSAREGKSAGGGKAGSGADVAAGKGGNDVDHATGTPRGNASGGGAGGASKRRDGGGSNARSNSSRGEPGTDRNKTQPTASTAQGNPGAQQVEKQSNSERQSSGRQRKQHTSASHGTGATPAGGEGTFHPEKSQEQSHRRPASAAEPRGGAGGGGSKEPSQGNTNKQSDPADSSAASKRNRARPDRQLWTPRPRSQPQNEASGS